jgi:hypothetical protein
MPDLCGPMPHPPEPKHPISRDCPECGSSNTREVQIRQTIPYRLTPYGGAEIVVHVPAICCDACQASCTDWRAEEIRTLAVEAFRKAR